MFLFKLICIQGIYLSITISNILSITIHLLHYTSISLSNISAIHLFHYTSNSLYIYFTIHLSHYTSISLYIYNRLIRSIYFIFVAFFSIGYGTILCIYVSMYLTILSIYLSMIGEIAPVNDREIIYVTYLSINLSHYQSNSLSICRSYSSY
jgi:hypothetical protein